MKLETAACECRADRRRRSPARRDAAIPIDYRCSSPGRLGDSDVGTPFRLRRRTGAFQDLFPRCSSQQSTCSATRSRRRLPRDKPLLDRLQKLLRNSCPRGDLAVRVGRSFYKSDKSVHCSLHVGGLFELRDFRDRRQNDLDIGLRVLELRPTLRPAPNPPRWLHWNRPALDSLAVTERRLRIKAGLADRIRDCGRLMNRRCVTGGAEYACDHVPEYWKFSGAILVVVTAG